jgi:hypothetical protein
MTHPSLLEQQQRTQKGRPLTPGTSTARMPRVLCWNCGRLIAWGVIPELREGEVLLLKCNRRECMQINEFGHVHKDGAA